MILFFLGSYSKDYPDHLIQIHNDHLMQDGLLLHLKKTEFLIIEPNKTDTNAATGLVRTESRNNKRHTERSKF